MNDFVAAAANASAAEGVVPSLEGFRASGSPADRLPPESLAKLRRIEAAAEDAWALCSASFERLDDAQSDWMRAANRLATLERDTRIGEESLAPARSKAEAARETLDRLRAEHDRRVAASQPIKSLNFELGRYVERILPSVAVIEPAAPVAAPALRKGENYLDAVSAQRSKLEKLRDDLAAVESATLPADEAKKIARRQIAELAEKGRPNVLQLIEGRREFSFAKHFVGAPFAYGADGQIVGRAGRNGYEPDSIALLAWLFEPQLVAAVEKEIDSAADPSSALSDEQIAKKRGQLRAAILLAEREEEALIEAAEAAGIAIARRLDSDPRAVLGLADSCPPPRS